MDTLDSRRTAVRSRIEALRQAMARNGLAAVIVPSSDPHLSEYLPERWKGREWLSGFTGSVGTLIVTRAAAGLWVDSRYWTQAEVQLAGTGIDLMKIPGSASLAHVDWLANELKFGDTVGVDGTVLALAAGRALESALTAKGIRLRTDIDLLAEIWPDRAALPVPPIFEHVPPYASTPRAAKLAAVREEMRKSGATHHFISTLDDIAWLTNLRGAGQLQPGVRRSPVARRAQPRLFVADNKVERAGRSPPTASRSSRIRRPPRRSRRCLRRPRCCSIRVVSRLACARWSRPESR
jgi:Xaa-Pro aminopeptidase